MRKLENNKTKKVSKIIKLILFISMLVLIYLVSPRLTNLIQNCARWIFELDNNYITRFIEILLLVCFGKFLMKK